MLDGIYISISGNVAQVFRFYKDGLLLDVLLRKDREDGWGDFSDLGRLLDREREVPGVIRGRYTLRGSVISFSTPGHYGHGEQVDYQGEKRGTELLLSALDHNTGRRSETLYQRIVG